MSLSIKNCRILHEGKLIQTNIFIQNGKISKIGSYVEADDTIDASGNIAIPGLIDSHVHFREPGFTYKEDFLSGSRAAASAGVTTIIDMPNTNPATITVEALEEKRELAAKSIVNYGFHFGSTENNLAEINKAGNTASVKVYMNHTTGNMLLTDDEILKNIFGSKKIISVHAEDEMIRKAVNFSRDIGNVLYVCHLNTKNSLDYVNENRNEKMFVETAPHYLFLTKEDENELVKMKPALQTKEDQEALWNGINNGSINTIGTDHAPHTIEEKESGEFFGVPGLETMLPLLLDAVNKNRITLSKLIELTSYNPAKIFGIKNKGMLKEGYDADITIVDMHMTKRVKNEELFTKCKWSPFNNWELEGWPLITIVNGNIVFGNGELYDIKAKEIDFNG